MGVPSFYRWLSEKYPKGTNTNSLNLTIAHLALVVKYCVEEFEQEVDGKAIPVNSSLPNPNQMEFDNLYLDMNGV